MINRLITWFLYVVFIKKNERYLDELIIIDKYLKRNGYDNYGNIYTKRFTYFEVVKKNKKVSSIIVAHDVSNKQQEITSNFVTGVIIADKYYNRL